MIFKKINQKSIIFMFPGSSNQFRSEFDMLDKIVTVILRFPRFISRDPFAKAVDYGETSSLKPLTQTIYQNARNGRRENTGVSRLFCTELVGTHHGLPLLHLE